MDERAIGVYDSGIGGTTVFKDLEDENATFANLLYKLNCIDGIEVIKFISPHPKDFTTDVIKAIKECEKVHKIIHLPLLTKHLPFFDRFSNPISAFSQ